MNESQLMELIEALSSDTAFGVLSSQRLLLELRRREGAKGFALYLDIDDLGEANASLGHERVNEKVRRALSFRCDDAIVFGRFYSGDELAGLMESQEEALGFARRIREGFRSEGMSCTIAVAQVHSGVMAAVRRAQEECHKQKGSGGKGSIWIA